MSLLFECVSEIDFFFFFSSRRRHTRFDCDWSSDVCSSDLLYVHDNDVSMGTGVTGVAENMGNSAVYTSWNIRDRKSTRLNSSHSQISYAVFCLKKKKQSRG